MDDYGLSVRQLAQTAGVTQRTARRWRKRGTIPEPYKTALRSRLGRDLGLASPAWVGWHFHNDNLISPEGTAYTSSDVRGSRLQLRAIEEYRAEVARRRVEAEFARELRARSDDLLNALANLINAADLLREYLPNSTRARPRPHTLKTVVTLAEHR